MTEGASETDAADRFVLRPERADPLGRSVSAAIVDEQDLVAGADRDERLAYTPDQLTDALLLIEDRHHDRDERRLRP
jgi:hypothetical protein